MFLVQQLIHQLELASGPRYARYVLAAVALMCLAVAYNLRVYKNFSAPEAMDAAQLARNIAEGKGYTTLFIRPFSMYLVKTRTQQRSGLPPAGKLADYTRIRDAHPDISNPPVYPMVLAGLMKVLSFHYTASPTKEFWSTNGRYQPDVLIALFNELLFGAVVVLSALWLRRCDVGVEGAS